MSKTAIEVITSVQRRRRWSTAEKERLVAVSLESGAGVSAVAREAGIHPSQLYGWRRQLCVRPQQAAGELPGADGSQLAGTAKFDSTGLCSLPALTRAGSEAARGGA
jgi:transposase-like protein